ncbi:hypothetical protein PUNSTDRAFT_143793 [Punctularia strigosozonata HHB-11173 SS5]|uniref:uncharacterized protein n=1 Tax=Punctularia strigosozonata (strain HHB-11173) TaxID=741275 RepID=UPI0004416618|nr:uncharacterized protein PUNSTDRAFT_143793 [Punctularia strigosozonata HHB-11173 SS5]EIN09323.1 hypothetical protein PUNSTDRAFT_143793 [Punctularia strigosozonata HHB-11173 SS5]
MPTTRGMLDSSPIRAPLSLAHAPKPTSSSSKTKPPPVSRTSSSISLPTPPRTQHKRKRGRSRHTDDSDSDDELNADKDVLPGVPDKGTEAERGAKRRKTGLDTIAEEVVAAEEEAFWAGSATKSSGRTVRIKVDEGSGEKTTNVAATPRSSTRVRAPLSPPPSRRQSRPKAQRTIFATALRPPQTPPRRSSRTAPRSKREPEAVRDSPNNPFLDKDSGDTDVSPFESPGTPPQRSEEEERPTVDYVFRGQKRTYANPYYNLTPSRRERAKLPPSHVDFSPEPVMPRKLLFPVRKRVARGLSHSSSSPSLDGKGGAKVKVPSVTKALVEVEESPDTSSSPRRSARLASHGQTSPEITPGNSTDNSIRGALPALLSSAKRQMSERPVTPPPGTRAASPPRLRSKIRASP